MRTLAAESGVNGVDTISAVFVFSSIGLMLAGALTMGLLVLAAAVALTVSNGFGA